MPTRIPSRIRVILFMYATGKQKKTLGSLLSLLNKLGVKIYVENLSVAVYRDGYRITRVGTKDYEQISYHRHKIFDVKN